VATAYFVDSSALVKRYVREAGTAWVRGITRRRPSTHIYIALITAVELTSAVARRRGTTLSAATAEGLTVDDPNSHP
jgi:predicted nucleic acid-binding protein